MESLELKLTYKGRTHIVTCQRRDIVKKIEELYHVSSNNIELYKKSGTNTLSRIRPEDIADFEMIEIYDKNTLTNGRDHEKKASGYDASFVQSAITKLRNNTPFNGIERKKLIEYLLDYDKNPKKRKREDSPDEPRRVSLNENAATVSPHEGRKPNTKDKKLQVNMSAQCKESFCQTDFPVNMKNPITTDTESTKDIDEERMITKMKKIAFTNKESRNESEAQRLMKNSFDHRRNYILIKIPTVGLVRDKYPLLFSKEEVMRELDRIFYEGKCKEFLDNMKKYAKFILESISSSDEIYISTMKRVSKLVTEKHKDYAKIVGSIFALAKIMHEDEFAFIHLRDKPHSSNNIFPHIDASSCEFSSLFFSEKNTYSVIVEEQKLCGTSDFLEALLCLMASFFIFNINYPPSNHKTLTVMEKIFLCANDTTEFDDMTAQMIKMLRLKAKQAK